MLKIPIYWWGRHLLHRGRLPDTLLQSGLVSHEIVILSQFLPLLSLGQVSQRHRAWPPAVVSAGTLHDVLADATPTRPESIVDHVLHLSLYLCVHVLLLVVGESLIVRNLCRWSRQLQLSILFILLGWGLL